MSKWEMVRFGDVCDVRDGTHDSPKYVEVGYPLITSKNLSNGIIDFDNVNFISADDYNKINQRSYVDDGDILMPMIGTIGNPIIVDKMREFAIKNVALIKCNNNNVLNRYVNYCLRSNEFVNYISKENRGGTQKFLSLNNIRKFGISLPPPHVQKHIADTLDKTQEIIDCHKKQLKELDNLIKATFYDMFGDPVVNDKGWKNIFLKDVLLDIRYGTSTPPVFSESGFKFIRATNIKNGRIVEEDMKFISEDEGKRIEKCKMYGNEMIIVRSGVNSGDTCIISDNYIGHYAGYDLILKFNQEKVLPYFINELFNTNYMEKVIKPLTRRAAQPHLNSDQVQSLLIILPKLELQNKYIKIVNKIEEQKSIVKRSITESQNLFNSLMSKYFD